MRTSAGGRKTARSRSTTASTTRTDLRPGDRSSRSPRHANALGTVSGGVFVSAFAKDSNAHARESSRRERFRSRVLHRHSAASSANARTARSARGSSLRGTPPRGAQALHRDARCGRRRGTHGHTDCRSATAGDAKHRSNGLQRHGFGSRPVRAALPWRMPAIARRCFDKTALAQSGRAAAKAAGRRFDSGTPTPGSLSGRATDS